jgi:hypothetical protein
MREKKVIRAGNMTLAISWSPRGIHLIDALPNRGLFNSSYFRQKILSGFHANLLPLGTTRPVRIRMDSTSPHRSKEMSAI